MSRDVPSSQGSHALLSVPRARESRVLGSPPAPRRAGKKGTRGPSFKSGERGLGEPWGRRQLVPGFSWPADTDGTEEGMPLASPTSECLLWTSQAKTGERPISKQSPIVLHRPVSLYLGGRSRRIKSSRPVSTYRGPGQPGLP